MYTLCVRDINLTYQDNGFFNANLLFYMATEKNKGKYTHSSLKKKITVIYLFRRTQWN